MIEQRYTRNIGTLTVEENLLLHTKRVCVVGCGGLGGYVIESLGRIGVGHITAIDDDRFDESNLNRQLTSEISLIGTSKALAAKKRMFSINPSIELDAIEIRLDSSNVKHLLADHDVIVDALDSIATRRVLQDTCEQLSIPLVHGAIGGWFGQVTVILPGDRTFDKIYPSEIEQGIEANLGNPSFTPAVVANIQVAETIKLLINRGEILSRKVLNIDLLHQDYFIFSI
ncbi:MAG: HesA/MoeB/ThiF family protein [Oscillospiraceae bacterium]|nr:HesA/MoeB/ThiF family protein [Oscillospiraceae bacterium]